MTTKISNQLGEYLKTSKSANTGPMTGMVETLPTQRDLANFLNAIPAQTIDPADQISDYLAKTPNATPDQLVRELGLKVSQVMTALDKLQRFGFIQLTNDGGKTTVALAGQR